MGLSLVSAVNRFLENWASMPAGYLLQ